jgi:hypothetical protein
MEDLPWIMDVFFFERLTVNILDIPPPLRPTVRVGHRDGSVGQPPGASTYKGRCDVTGILGNVVLVNSDFHKSKNFSNICSRLARTLWKIANPFLTEKVERIEAVRGRKLLACSGRQITNLSGASTCFGPVVLAVKYLDIVSDVSLLTIWIFRRPPEVNFRGLL